MDTIKIPDATLHRRRFFGAAAISIAAAKLGLLESATHRWSNPKRPKLSQAGQRARPSAP
jgi:hypothetical protein